MKNALFYMKNILLFIIFNSSFFSFGQEHYILYFDTGKADISKTEMTRFQNWISFNKESKILAINGFTDEDGTNQFNDSLSKKRVDFAYNCLQKYLVIRSDFKSRSFGENFIQSKNKSENRKVVIYYILKKDLNREDEILRIKPLETKIVVKTDRSFSDKMEIENSDGSVTKMVLDLAFMKAIDESKAGDKLKLENLNFVINTFIVTNSSRPKMFELLTVLRENPKLKIEIQGNLCCQPIDRLNLSTERAKAIYNFLVFYKIDKSRLSYKGFGSSNPLFPLPEKSEEERAANRRVEILILENE